MLTDCFSKRNSFALLGSQETGVFPRVTGKQPAPSVPILPGPRLQQSQQLPMQGWPQAGPREIQVSALHRQHPIVCVGVMPAVKPIRTPAMNPNLRYPGDYLPSALECLVGIKSAQLAPLFLPCFPPSLYGTARFSQLLRLKAAASAPPCSCITHV